MVVRGYQAGEENSRLAARRLEMRAKIGDEREREGVGSAKVCRLWPRSDLQILVSLRNVAG